MRIDHQELAQAQAVTGLQGDSAAAMRVLRDELPVGFVESLLCRLAAAKNLG